MKVSVIVPVYNVAPYLARCLDSLLSQTLSDLEIIVVNDGSTDESAAILADYVQRYGNRIRAFLKENGGQGSARNLGIRNATGEYIGFVDADDYVASDMFERMYQTAVQSDADMVTCDYYYITSESKKRVSLYKPSTQTDMFFNPWAAPWNKLYRRSIIVDNEVFFPELRAYEDTAFYANAIPFVNKIANVPEAFVYQYYRGSSTMNKRQDERVLLIFDVLQYVMDFYRQHGVYEQYAEYLEYFCVKILFSSSILRICQIRDRKVRREYLRRTIAVVKSWFPNYRTNRFFRKGVKGLYIRTINAWTLPIYANLIYVVRYMGRSRL